MKIHTIVTQQNGIITVALSALFTAQAGDPEYTSDQTDQQKIQAFGDPLVNVAGTFTDPNDTTFSFGTPATEKYVGVTTKMLVTPLRFMFALPQPTTPNLPTPTQQALDVITTDVTRAVEVWRTSMLDRINQAMAKLRVNQLLPTFTDATVPLNQ